MKNCNNPKTGRFLVYQTSQLAATLIQAIIMFNGGSEKSYSIGFEILHKVYNNIGNLFLYDNDEEIQP